MRTESEIYNSDYSRYSMIVDQVVGNPARLNHIFEIFGSFKYPVSTCFNETLDLLKSKFGGIDWSYFNDDARLAAMENIANFLALQSDETSHRLSRTLKWCVNNHRDRLRMERRRHV